MSDAQTDYSKTVRLPETAFPMKAGLAENEPKRLQAWEKAGLYARLRQARQGAPKWVLHDGPPFANGDIHMGTALNKVLKDILVRYQSMRGFDAPYVPGWDCHGMPIEFKVSKALGAERHKKTPLEIRALCRAEAEKYVAVQREQFKRLGVWGDWEHPYLTLSPDFEAAQLDVYWQLLKSGQIYRGTKPVHWCVYDQTALADAELEYKEKTSPAIYVKYPLDQASASKTGAQAAVVWTTTPWTLPASLAITANERFEYGVFDVKGESWLLNVELAKPLLEKLGVQAKPKSLISGKDLEGLKARHPFIEGREIRFCTAAYVTLDAGTGLVHTAPGHGTDDFVTGSRYKLPVLCPVDAQGRFTDEYAPLKGQRVTDPEANAAIIATLKAKGALVLEEELEHSYPHCWRCKNPIIFRATQQWFMSLENNGLRDKVMAETGKVQWLTRGGKERFSNMMKDRADWCISRQRVWGVPIYMYNCAKCGGEHFNEEHYKKLRPIVAKEGGDAWFDPARPMADFLPPGDRCSCGSHEFKRETDTLDVWFDSGSSHTAVLKARPELAFPADLYLEGSDQYRGWFQSSMLVSAGVNGAAPYKAVWSTGWMLDAKGAAMHKSAGNAVNPLDVMKVYGADILRLWCASEDVTVDLRLGEEILKTQADVYRRVRNTLRWLLGSLSGFEPAKDRVERGKLEPLDRWLLGRLDGVVAEVTEAMQAYSLQRAYARLTGFCSSELSSLAFDIHKDTLYTLAEGDPRRRSARSALYEVLQALLRLFAPFLVFTCEEAWEHMPPAWKDAESVHLARWPEAPKAPPAPELEGLDLLIERVRPAVSKRLEEARAAKLIGHPYDAKVSLAVHSKKALRALNEHAALLPQLFIVSEVSLTAAAPQDGLQVSPDEVKVEASAQRKCARCWRRPGDVKEEGGICGRCEAALGAAQ